MDSKASYDGNIQATDPGMAELGIGLVPPVHQTQKPVQLFFVWCAANIGILGVVYGAVIVSFGLSFWQAILAAVAGVASFALVGITSIAGKIGRTTTLTLSRVIFGKRGNIAPTSFCWVNLMGWEAVNIITGTLTLVALMMQKWITRIFGAMTLLVVIYLLFTADWQAILALPSGSWLTGFLPAVSIIAAGTGISWAIAGADYSRDQRPDSGEKPIFLAVVSGAALPLLLLMLTGILLTAQIPDLASSENPISAIGKLLPSWMAIPYLAAATAGVVTIAVLSLYSASLNLLSMGIKLQQRSAVALDAVLVLGIALYVLFVSKDFLGPFIAFLIFCGVFLAAWAAIFMVDFYRLRRRAGYPEADLFRESGANRTALGCWIVGALAGLMVSKTGFIDGPFAVGIFADSSLGLFVSFILSLALYLAFGMRKGACRDNQR